MVDNTGHTVGPEPSWLDDSLRAALTRMPEESGGQAGLPAAMLDEIDRAIDMGWPHGQPLTLDELAAQTDSADNADAASPANLIHEHTWADPVADHGASPSHVHGVHHHEDHCAHIDPDPGPHL